MDLRWLVKRYVYYVWDDEVDARVERHIDLQPVLQYREMGAWYDIPTVIKETK